MTGVNQKRFRFFNSPTFWTIMGWSFFTTAIGMMSVLPVTMPMYQKFAIVILASFALQLAIGTAYPKAYLAYRTKRPIAFILCTITGLSVSLMSGAFASSTNISIFLSTLVKDRQVQSFQQGAIAPVTAVAEKAHSVSLLFSNYSNFASEEAKTEMDKGNSCDGISKGNECGPLCRLRKKQSEEADKKSLQASSLASSADALIASTGGVDTQAGINSIFEQARTLGRSKIFVDLQSYVNDQKNGFSNGFNWEGELRFCPDREATVLLNEIDALMATPIELPALPPTVRDLTLSDIAGDNIATIWKVLRAFLIGSNESQKVSELLTTSPGNTYSFFWLVSLLIELACAVLGIKRIQRKIPFLPTDGDLSSLSESDVERAKLIYKTWSRLTVVQNRKTYFFLPFQGSENIVNRNAWVLVNMLRLPAFKVSSPLDVYAAAEPEFARRFEVETGTTFAKVYRISNPRKIERRLASILGFQNPRDPEILLPGE